METASRTINVTRKRTLKDGSIREYQTVQTYYLKGYLSKNNERVQKKKPTDEQKAEIKKRYADGVKKKRLGEDYQLTFARVQKILDEA